MGTTLSSPTATGTTMSTAELMGDAGMTILIGLVVVFGVLILLTLVFYLFGKTVSRGGGTANTAPAAPPPAAPQPVAKAARPAAAADEDEVVAVIAAAVAAMGAADGKRYAVKGIRRAGPAQGGRQSAWAMAGLAESTRPF